LAPSIARYPISLVRKAAPQVSQFREDLLKRGHEETSGTRGEVGERNGAGMGNEEDKQSLVGKTFRPVLFYLRVRNEA
jgi:hypothetical protein